MAPPTSRSKAHDKQPAAALQAEGTLAAAPKVEKINLGDTLGLKRALDDVVVQTVSEAGYAIDYIYTDSKIAIGSLACIVACVAQFWPLKHPANFWLLVACVAAYVVLSAAMSAVATFLEKNAVALTKPRPGQPPIAVCSTLPRFQSTYTLAIRPRGDRVGCPVEVKLARSVGAYFDRDGVLAREALQADVSALLQRYHGKGGGGGKPKGQ